MPWLNQLDKRLAAKALVQEKQHYLLHSRASRRSPYLEYCVFSQINSRYVVFHELKQGHYQLLPTYSIVNPTKQSNIEGSVRVDGGAMMITQVDEQK